MMSLRSKNGIVCLARLVSAILQLYLRCVQKLVSQNQYVNGSFIINNGINGASVKIASGKRELRVTKSKNAIQLSFRVDFALDVIRFMQLRHPATSVCRVTVQAALANLQLVLAVAYETEVEVPLPPLVRVRCLSVRNPAVKFSEKANNKVIRFILTPETMKS
ncbi:hypothetical protein CLF_102756 [Clonorchis sinensis]|uniref:Uncharacterized protein n=1 Tax=Clonorchis sinensis TaxID=79923 RepID=G7Y8G2_CLOSI|nr:hypothetical protein CLF_102756 [Clonorchis sinensis]